MLTLFIVTSHIDIYCYTARKIHVVGSRERNRRPRPWPWWRRRRSRRPRSRPWPWYRSKWSQWHRGRKSKSSRSLALELISEFVVRSSHRGGSLEIVIAPWRFLRPSGGGIEMLATALNLIQSYSGRWPAQASIIRGKGGGKKRWKRRRRRRRGPRRRWTNRNF